MCQHKHKINIRVEGKIKIFFLQKVKKSKIYQKKIKTKHAIKSTRHVISTTKGKIYIFLK